MMGLFKKKKNPWGKVFLFIGLMTGLSAIAILSYKFIENKIKSMLLGIIDLDDDGKNDAIMLDTTGDGELDTIILNSTIE